MVLTDVQTRFLEKTAPLIRSKESDVQAEIVEAAFLWANNVRSGMRGSDQAVSRLLEACEKADG